MTLGPGDTFDRYTIEALIGQGGMGRVYRARDQRLRRRIALKILHRETDSGEVAVSRVLREARAAAALDHPGSVSIFDVGEIDGIPYIAMEHVVGRPLRELVGDSTVPLRERLRWLRDIARVLAVAHAAGLVHRDVKPENVMIRGDGSVKVLDFGIARHVLEDEELAAAWESEGDGITLEESERCGTPAYMAPEQAQGREIDARADQFAWGVLAYELLSGALPWRSPAEGVTTLVAVITERQSPLSPLLGLPPRVAAAIDRALEKDPARRFPSMDALLVALDDRPARRTPSTPAAESDSFVGRIAELDRLRAVLEDGARLVTVVGPPGVGKSRLLRAAIDRDLAARFHGRVWMVDLSEAETTADLVHGISRALGVSLSIEIGAQASVEPLAAMLASQGRAALILDGADRIVARAPASIGRILERAGALSILVTSRERLHLRGEHVLEIGPLAVPGEGDVVEAIERADAVALFVDRARAVRPGYRPDAATWSTIGALVRHLDGLPLAIEVAAARMTMLDPRGLLDRLDRRSGAPRRDASGVDAALEASWNLLDPIERSALAQCSVFRGGFDLDAAEAVIDLGDVDVVDALGRLRDRSLIAAREPDVDGPPRLFLYLTIRAFAADKLDGEARDAAFRRHARWYAIRTKVLADAVEDTGSAVALAALAVERENLRVIAERLADDPSEREVVARALLAVDPLEHAEGSLGDHAAALDRAISSAPAGALRRRLEIARARALLALGRSGEVIGALADAVDDPEASLLLARAHASVGALVLARERALDARSLATRSPHLIHAADRALARIERDAGRLGAATVLYRRARLGFHAAGAHVDEGQTATELGLVLARQGGAEAALGVIHAAIAQVEGAADPRLAAAARAALGAVVLELGRYAEAQAACEEALAEQRRRGDRAGEALTLGLLAAAQLDDDDPERARETVASALIATDSAGLRAQLRWCAAIAAWCRDDLDLASAEAREGLMSARVAGDRLREGLLAATLGAIEASRGRTTEAARALDEARRAHASIDDDAATTDAIAVESTIGQPLEIAAVDLALGFDELRRARDLAARSHRDAAESLTRARRRLSEVLAPRDDGAPLVRRSFVVRALARRLARALSPAERALSWAEAADPGREALIVDVAARGFRLPGASTWTDLGDRRRSLRLLASLIEHRLAHRRVDASTLAEAIWPDDEIEPDMAATEVAREIDALRAAGLVAPIDRNAEGWALAPTWTILAVPTTL